jgi:hypothetical protein
MKFARFQEPGEDRSACPRPGSFPREVVGGQGAPRVLKDRPVQRDLDRRDLEPDRPGRPDRRVAERARQVPLAFQDLRPTRARRVQPGRRDRRETPAPPAPHRRLPDRRVRRGRLDRRDPPVAPARRARRDQPDLRAQRAQRAQLAQRRRSPVRRARPEQRVQRRRSLGRRAPQVVIVLGTAMVRTAR